MNKSSVFTILFILAVISIAGFFTYLVTHPGENAKNSEAARSLLGDDESGIEVRYTDLDGNEVDLSQYAGKTRVVNSWASWCPFCTEELKDLQKLSQEYGDEIVVIAINRSEQNEKAKAYLKRLGDTSGIVFVQDEKDVFYKSIGGFAMPETVFYAEDGSIVSHKRGVMQLSEMQNNTTAALNTSQ